MNVNDLNKARLFGGVSDLSDTSAPKEIVSREPKKLRFSVGTDELDAKKTFEVVCDGDKAAFRFRGTAELGEKLADIDFAMSGAEVSELQDIVEKYDVARFNGYHRLMNRSEGDSFNIDIDYKSGERICASGKGVEPDGWKEAQEAFLEYFNHLVEKKGYTLAPLPLKTAISKKGTVVASYLPTKSHMRMSISLEVRCGDITLDIFVCEILGITKNVHVSFEITEIEIKDGFSAVNSSTGETVTDIATVEKAVIDGEYYVRLSFDGTDPDEVYRI